MGLGMGIEDVVIWGGEIVRRVMVGGVGVFGIGGNCFGIRGESVWYMGG